MMDWLTFSMGMFVGLSLAAIILVCVKIINVLTKSKQNINKIEIKESLTEIIKTKDEIVERKVDALSLRPIEEKQVVSIPSHTLEPTKSWMVLREK